MVQQKIYIINKKVIIFEKGKNSNIRYQAYDKVGFLFLGLGLFYQNTRVIIYNNCDSKDKNINRDEHHVKITARSQEPKPSCTVRQQKENNSDKRKEYKELKRIKQHRS